MKREKDSWAHWKIKGGQLATLTKLKKNAGGLKKSIGKM